MRVRQVLRFALVTALVAALASPPVALGGPNGKTYKPPYKKGNQGGDAWNHIEADPQSGHVEVYRVFPGFSPVVGCAPEPDAGWVTLTQPHDATASIDKVIVEFDASLEPYAWVYAVVWDAREESIGIDKFQGPHYGPGRLKVDLFRQPRPASTITIEFGAQVGDACPQVGAASVDFSSIKIE